LGEKEEKAIFSLPQSIFTAKKIKNTKSMTQIPNFALEFHKNQFQSSIFAIKVNFAMQLLLKIVLIADWSTVLPVGSGRGRVDNGQRTRYPDVALCA
jgi:hypothetical protein